MKKYLRMAAFWYPVTVFGKGKKLAVWFQGCSKKCKACISPEYQKYDGGTDIAVEELFSLMKDTVPDGLIISGGEPFDQPEALYELVNTFEARYGDDILVYTGYQLDELTEKNDPMIEGTIKKIAVLIDGNYIQEMDSGKGLAGSKNQKIYVMKHQQKYQDAENWERQLMCILREDNSIWMIGVPPLEA